MCKDKDKLCILVVDDIPDNLQIIRLSLETVGYQTCGARTGGEAMSLLDERCKRGETCPDLVIVDIDLPDMRGGTLGMKIREHYPKLPFIYLTAYGKLPVYVDIAKAQDAPLLTKPVELDELVAEIEAHVKDFRSRRMVGTPIRDGLPRFVEQHINEIEKARGLRAEANGKA